MNTLWNTENAVINFDVRKWGRNIKQTALNFEQGLHVKSSELTESEGEKIGGQERSTLSSNSYSGPDNKAERKAESRPKPEEGELGENGSLSTWCTSQIAKKGAETNVISP